MTQTVLLGDIAYVTKLAGYEFTKHITYDDDGEIVALRALNLRDGRLDLTDTKRISREVSEKLPRSQLKRGDILLSYTGTLGNFAMVEADDTYHLAPNVCLIRANDMCIPEYLYYTIASPVFKQQLLGVAHGSTQATVPMRNIRNLKVQIPSLDQQRQIVDKLMPIDEKIELNRKMNETLEQMGQALFRHYFIDNPEAEKWGDGIVSDLVTIYSGYAFKRTDFNSDGTYGLVTIKNVQDGNFITECSDHLADVPAKVPDYIHIKTGDVLLSLTGNVGRVCIAYGEKLLLNQRVAKLAGAKDCHSLAYFMFRQNEFKDRLISMSRGTAQLNLSPIEIKKIKMKLPPEDTLENFYSEAEPLFEMITDNYQQIQTLTTLRDTLLPRLISGKIKINGTD